MVFNTRSSTNTISSRILFAIGRFASACANGASAKIACWAMLSLAFALTSPASAAECSAAQSFEHTFSSGANWEFCVQLDDDHALEIQNLFYRAPGDTSRQVLTNLHLGQALLHYHNQEQPTPLIGDNELGRTGLRTLTEKTCDGELHALDDQPDRLCTVERNIGLLAKYNTRPGLQGGEYRVFSVSEYEGLTFQIQVALTEDGRIRPSVILSGKSESTTTNPGFGNALVEPLSNNTVLGTRATLLYTWRMAFALNNDDADDSVEEFNFKLEPSQGSKRPMSVSKLTTEAFRDINRNQFRGWRVKDRNGSGYYLDPQNSGYGYADKNNNWAQFDMAFTNFNACERHSRIGERGIVTDEITGEIECQGSLDDFVNGESLIDERPVLWYSLSRVYRPKVEDYPIISSMHVDFELTPFDWTPTSPFEVVR